MTEKSTSLTGVWNGQYSYPRGLAPVSFVATLIETTSYLMGTTHEAGSSVVADGPVAYASIAGSRQSRDVTFVKTYENVRDGQAKPISYVGLLNGDATQISGRWVIPGVWSGEFVMIRAPGKKAAVRRKATAKI